MMFSVVTKYHKGRHSLFLYNSEIFYAFTQDILRSPESLNLSKFKTTDSTPPPTIFPTTIPTFTGLYSFGFMFPSVSAKSMSIICFSMLNTHY
ncbi:hypothetical protein C6Y11_08635 [Lactiplantibacillus pentosus]|nr:hypothetical protein C6Y11_08635 [Lactiplantibacillus pentosus]